MPELPEVETIVRDLARLLPGRRIEDARVLKDDLVEVGDARQLERDVRGETIRSVTRRAKNIVLDLGERLLVVNLGMTGRLLVVPAGEPDPAHLGARFVLDDGRQLLYHDVRRFGRLMAIEPAEWARRQESMGWEPLDERFTPDELLRLAQGSRVAIKTWLMDLRRIVGVGNIYASEALFRARIDPRRPARSLSPDEAVRLHAAIREVLLEAINFRGTTLLDYRDASGEQGAFADRLRVYDREGEPCRTCGEPIQRIVQGGRSTFFCARCQG